MQMVEIWFDVPFKLRKKKGKKMIVASVSPDKLKLYHVKTVG